MDLQTEPIRIGDSITELMEILMASRAELRAIIEAAELDLDDVKAAS